MKMQAPPAMWTHRAWTDDVVRIDENRSVTRDTSVARAEREFMVRQRAGSDCLATPLRVVGILAFCQAIGFLALFLLLCARAGAATESKPAPRLTLTLSTYATEAVRDPFGAEVPKTSGAAGTGPNRAEDFKLMGILYSATSPSALVNGQLVDLNKLVRMQIGRGEVEVKAVTITRDQVVLEVGGQKVGLRLGGPDRDKGSK